jgi:hypothetical protein
LSKSRYATTKTNVAKAMLIKSLTPSVQEYFTFSQFLKSQPAYL